MEAVIAPKKKISALFRVPGDKSISHRVLFIGSIAEGVSRIKNFLPSRDCLATLNCLRQLGVKIEESQDSLIVYGNGIRSFKEPREILDAQNSGTTSRLLCGLLAGQSFISTITGDESLRKRPMDRITEPLRLMGAEVSGAEGGKFLPLTIRGGHLKGITYRMPVASAQAKSCILLAGLLAEGETTVEEPLLTRDHTERLLLLAGAPLEKFENKIKIKQGILKPFEITVPGDISSAAFFMAVASIIKGSRIGIAGVGVNPTRAGILKVLEDMGARIEIKNAAGFELGEPVADIVVESSELSGVEVPPDLIPEMIDELPVLAVAATQAKGKTRVTGASELKVKETDRIKATVTQLKKMGADIEELPDGFVIKGPTKLKGARVESFKDHRMAMSLAVAGMAAEGETIISDAECVNVSFPGFWEILERL